MDKHGETAREIIGDGVLGCGAMSSGEIHALCEDIAAALREAYAEGQAEGKPAEREARS